jgi:hypothetical protein
MKISYQALKIAAALNQMKRKVRDDEPKGLPEMSSNDNQTPDGAYEQEKLTDPGILHPVTGTGSGPIIGRRSRVYLKKGI